MKHRSLPILLLAGYLVWPYATLLKLQYDLRTHDVSALRADVDWDGVRGGLKQDVLDGFAGRPVAIKASADSDDLPAFGESFASNVAGAAMEQAITPQRLADAFAAVTPPGGPSAQPALEGAGFDGLTSFVVELLPPHAAPTDPPVRLTMRLGARGWRVTHVCVPDNLLRQTFASAS
jgi:hypothetical protein